MIPERQKESDIVIKKTKQSPSCHGITIFFWTFLFYIKVYYAVWLPHMSHSFSLFIAGGKLII
jgi:hypothetical protein